MWSSGVEAGDRGRRRQRDGLVRHGVLSEPIALADGGAPVGAFLASGSAEARTLDLQPETIAMFRRPDGTPLQVGESTVQHDLAKTFRLIAEQGVDVFYKGEIARAIVDAQKRLSPTKPIAGGEGRMTLADLANLRVAFTNRETTGPHILTPPEPRGGVRGSQSAGGCVSRRRRSHPR